MFDKTFLQEYKKPYVKHAMYGSLAMAAFMIIVTFVFSFDGGRPTCEQYIRNTYLYTSTEIIITAAVFMVLVYTQANTKFMQFIIRQSIGIAIVIAIAFVVAYFATLIMAIRINKNKVVLKHLVAFVFVLMSGFLFSLFQMEVGLREMGIVLGITAAIFVVLSVLAFKFQDRISSQVTLTFLIIFIIGLLIELVAYMIAPGSIWTMAITTFMLVLIIWLAMKHTKRMIENQKTCQQNGGPDYVAESMSFFVDFKNIFIRVMDLRKGRRQ